MVLGAQVLGVGTAYTGLYYSWYKQYNTGQFDFFDDSEEWLQMDKAGHFVTAFHLARAGAGMYRWAGRNEEDAAKAGYFFSIAFLTGVEIMDGFSEGWGFSIADFRSNVAGASLFLFQDYFLKDKPISLKFSYHNSPFAQYRPELLGSSGTDRWLKDYNGQTYWLGLNLKSIMGRNCYIPEWVSLAFGYGAEGMTGGSRNPEKNAAGMQIPVFKRERQFYFSPDIDLWRIKWKSRWMEKICNTFGFIKVPLPALELKSGKMFFHPLYF